MYCTVPVQMKIDNIRLETIGGIPRDMRVLVRLTRALTSNSYGDRVEYLTDMDSVVKQAKYLGEMGKKKGSLIQMEAITDMLGIDTSSLKDMVNTLERSDVTESAEYLTEFIVSSVVTADHIRVIRKNSTKIIDVSIAGIETPLYNKLINNRSHSQPYGRQAYDKVKTLLKQGTIVKLKYIARLANSTKGSDHRVCHVYIETKDDLGNPTNTNLGRYLLQEGLAFVSEKYIDADTIRTYHNDTTVAKSTIPVKGIWKEKNPETPSQFIIRLGQGRR